MSKILHNSGKNVNFTTKLDLCISCEICSSICPENAIEMIFEKGQFLPYINKEKCKKCSLCFKICPGMDIDYSLVNKKITSKDLSGECIESYVAYSKSNEIRKKSTSGGIITNLILELIKSKIYDEAFVLDFEVFDGKPARLKSENNPEKIIKASKSKYVPVSVKNVITSLKNNKTKKYIIVGTSCQILGIKKFLKEYKISEKNLIFFGLFCDKTMNFNFLKYFEEKYKIKDEKLIKFEFRNKDISWPGDCKLYFDSGRCLLVDRKKRMELKRYFQLNRCLFCLDKLNNLADISFGDCYIKDKTSLLGNSVLIIRTKKGKEIFDKFSKKFNFEKIKLDEISKSQKLLNKNQNINYIKYLVNENDIFDVKFDKVDNKIKKNLLRIQEEISFGEKNNNRAITKKIKLSKYQPKQVLKIAFKIPNIFLSKNKSKSNDNIIIVGGGFSNKGAQAMVFSTVNQLKSRFPDKNIYLFSKKENDIYNFNVISFKRKTALKLLLEKTKNQNNFDLQEKQIKEIISNTAFFIDISGYALSSKFGFYSNLNYLLNIAIAKKYSIPFYILPQSIGPFNYKFKEKLILYPLMILLLKYPKRIFIREDKGIKDIKKFTNKNVFKSHDIVLYKNEYNVKDIFRNNFEFKKIDIKQNSVGIIPSIKLFDSAESNEIYSFYKILIKKLIELQKTVYIFNHSSDDIEICKKIKSYFFKESKVLLIEKNLNAIELEYLLKQFDYVIASRYHSIIHAYKNQTPAIVISWADKYQELLKSFNQIKYNIDIKDISYSKNIFLKINEMNDNYIRETKHINKRIKELKKENIFNIIFKN